MSGDTKRVLEVNQIDNLQGSTQRVKQETTLNNLRGITQRVYVVGGGSAPVIDELNVTPSTSAQTITAPEGVDGYSPVNVSAVDSTIDANIVAGNIKKDVQILGVTGSYEGQTPTGTMYIISNGTYNVADKAIANVQVPTTAPAHYIDRLTDNNSKLLNSSSSVISLSGATDIGDYALYYKYFKTTFPANTSANLSGFTKITGICACQHMFESCTGITSVDLSSLSTVSGQNACQYMFGSCTGITSVDLSGLSTVSGQNACQYMFSSCTGITSVDLSGLSTVSGQNACQYMFGSCTGITSVDLSSLSTVSGQDACVNMFGSCTGITSVDLSGLTTISGTTGCYQMFYNCSNLTSIDLSSLTTVSGTTACLDMFLGCTGLTSIYLPKISDTDHASRLNMMSSAFVDCTSLTVADLRNFEYCGDYGILDSLFNAVPNLTVLNLNSLRHIGREGARGIIFIGSGTSSTLKDLYFPMLTTFGTNPFYSNAFTGRLGLTIHFRKDAQATVQALANYATLWGAGTGSSVVFDLAGTLTGADSNAYARAEKYSVYASETAGAAKTATAWRYNNTTYYTAGDSEPQVGDTIYSDSACTTAVTTISSIA